MFDRYDPRDDDSRDRDDGIRDREDDWLELGRDRESATGRRDHTEHDARDRDERWRDDRDREPPDRDEERSRRDPRDVFMRDLELPRGEEREIVRDRDREYSLRGSETRTLSTVGAFRIVDERDVRDP